MFKRIVIGVHERNSGKDAVKLAKRLADPDATMTMVRVYPDAPTTWRRSSSVFDSVELQHAQDVLTNLRRETGIHAALRPLAASSTGRGLHAAVGGENADLLVLGSSRHGLLGRVLLGDDTKQAVNGAPCPVVVAPAGYANHDRAILRVGVGYDATPESELALAAARGLASDLHADLSVLGAVEIPTYAFMAASPPVSADFIDSMVDSAFKQVSELPGVEPHACYGHAAEELAHYSGSVDLLVVGSRGYGPIGRLVHGSTTSSLMSTSHCPLLVLTRVSARRLLEADRNGAAALQDQSAWVGATVARHAVRS